MRISSYLEWKVEALLAAQLRDGAIPPGSNGPYHDRETPVRNTSHAIIAFLRLYELTGNKGFRIGAEKALDYLFTTKNRTQFTFVQRCKAGKDASNGLIGPAWNMEAMIYAYRKLGQERCLTEALRIFNLFTYDYKHALWIDRVEPDGSRLPVDHTFNHQLWFGVASYPLLILTGDENVSRSLVNFAKNLTLNMWFKDKSGRIAHDCRSKSALTKYVIKQFIRRDQNARQAHKEVGYQTFNLYAFARLNQEEPELQCLGQKKVRRAISFLKSESFTEMAKTTEFGFAYNPVGYELAVVNGELGGPSAKEAIRSALADQRMYEGCPVNGIEIDVPLQMARVYELAQLNSRYLELEIE